MLAFGWDIEYVTSLSFPVFLYLTGILKRVRTEYAIDSFFAPYVAAKAGKSAVDNLYKTAGSFYIEKPVYQEPVTPENLKLAHERLDRMIAAREQQLANAAADSTDG